MKKAMEHLDSQFCEVGNYRWRISRLVKLAEDLKPFKLPLKHINSCGIHPQPKTTLEYIKGVKRLLQADLKYPIILDDEGGIMDGRHRLLKAMLKEKDFVMAVRFKEDPEPCEITGKDE